MSYLIKAPGLIRTQLDKIADAPDLLRLTDYAEKCNQLNDEIEKIPGLRRRILWSYLDSPFTDQAGVRHPTKIYLAPIALTEHEVKSGISQKACERFILISAYKMAAARVELGYQFATRRDEEAKVVMEGLRLSIQNETFRSQKFNDILLYSEGGSLMWQQYWNVSRLSQMTRQVHLGLYFAHLTFTILNFSVENTLNTPLTIHLAGLVLGLIWGSFIVPILMQEGLKALGNYRVAKQEEYRQNQIWTSWRQS